MTTLLHRLAAGILLTGLLGISTRTDVLRAQDKKEDKKTEKKAQPKVPADQPIIRDVDRHKKFLEIAKMGGVDVLFMGDSITQGWEGAGKEAWKKHFEPMKAANFGIGGDRTGHVIWRITEGKELEGIDPKVCVMMIGTNNSGEYTAEEIATGIEAILREFKKQKPNMKVLLLGVFPRASSSGLAKDVPVAGKDKLSEDRNNVKIPKLNALIAKFADGKTVFYKDIGGKFLDKDGGLPRELMPDLLHLSPKGYDIWAEAIKADVEKLLKGAN